MAFVDRYTPKPMISPTPSPGTDPSMRHYGDPVLKPLGAPTGLERSHALGEMLAQAAAVARAPHPPMDMVAHSHAVMGNWLAGR